MTFKRRDKFFKILAFKDERFIEGKKTAYAIILLTDFDVKSFASSFFRVHGSWNTEHRRTKSQLIFVIYTFNISISFLYLISFRIKL